MILKKTFKHLLFILIFALLPITAAAYDFMVDGLCYNKNSDGTSVTVTYQNTSSPRYSNLSGNLVIPETVTYSDISYSVTSIGNYAFYGCSGLTSVTIPNSVTSIGEYAFHGCSGLTSVTIPNSVTSIGDGAFSYCSSLTSVTIPNSVTSIDSGTFAYCSNMTSITIPNSVTFIDGYAFANCSGLTSVHITDLAAWCNIVYEDIGSNPLLYAHHLYLNGNEVKDLVIPNSVTSIGNYAFIGCGGLTSISIPSSVTSIGNRAFERCSGTASIVVDNGNPFYDSRDNCNAIVRTTTNTLIVGCKNTIIPNSVTSIGDGAFFDCSGLTSITIPNSVTSIGNQAFQSCSNLTSATIGNSVTSIGDHAFYGCSGLTSVTIPNSVTSIGAWAFYGCTSLTGVTIGNSVTSIGNYAFQGCSGLTSVTIPNSVTSIGDGAFQNCSGLTSVTIGNSVTSIGGYAFYICSGLTSVTIPNSVTSIGGYAFGGCGGLTSITLTGNGYWYYNSNSHRGLSQIINQFKTVNIGSGITSLGGFNFNPNVVNCYAEVPPTCSSSTFASYNGVLHVPASSMADYFIADYWQNFTNLNNDITEKVTLNTTSATLVQHDELQLSATVTPNVSAIIWSSTNQNVATVDNSGKVTATGQGECYIYATFATNPAVYARCQITANYPEITSLTLSEIELVFNQIGETFTLAAITTPANSGPKPTWTSSDEAVATVDANGLVTAINLGECDITATVLNQSATCHVTVTSAIIITLDMASATIVPNEILTLTPSFNPVETDIVATSSDASVAFARVITQNGFKKVQVLGLVEGTATITVASVDGKAIPATCVVTVSNAPDVLMGDANGDGTVNVSDYVYVANYILEQNPEPFVFAAADIDGNSEINVSDLVLVANIALTYEDPNTLNAHAPKATLNADIDMNATLHKNADGTTSITVDLNNSMDLTALQMDISLPQGMAVTGATLTDRATRSHQPEVAQLANGNYRLLAASSASKAFKGNEGALLTIRLSGEPQGTVTLGGIKLASPDGQCFTVNDMLLTPVVTGVDDITAQARIYGEADNIVIESPIDGMAQLVLPNGMSRTVKVKSGRNIYPAPATGLVIVRAGEKAVKLIF